MNNLTQREKVLIYLILGTLPVLLIFFGFNWFMGQLKKKSLELDAVSRQLADIELRADLAMIKTDLKNQFRQRSLSSNENVAQGEYREWLRNLVETEVKFSGTPKVTSRGNVQYKSSFGQKNVIYTQLGFQLDCQGSYKQIVEFLYRFYEKNYIHRITRLDLSLVKGKRVEGKVTFDRNRFNVNAQIQVLSLVDADPIRSPIGVENTKLFFQSEFQDKIISELEDYKAVVLRRNLFGFPNNAPDFGSRKKEFDFEEGDRVSIRLSADDEDDDDLEYMLESTDGKVTSDKIDQSRSGSFRLDIEKLGTYEFKAKVVDKNYYPKTDEMLVVVNIEEKKREEKKEPDPPPPPRFDPLKFTFLEAIVRNFEGTPICWINVRPYGKLHKVSAGAKFDVGRKEIEVIQINRRDAVISIDGDHYKFAVNDALGDPQGKALLTAKKEKREDDKQDPPEDGAKESERKTIDVNAPNPNAKSTDQKGSDAPENSESSKDDSKPVKPEGADNLSKDSSAAKSKDDAKPSEKEKPAENEQEDRPKDSKSDPAESKDADKTTSTN